MSSASPSDPASVAGSAAPATPAKPAGGGYDVGRPQGNCCVCGQAIVPEERYMAALRETPLGFERLDCMLGCWERCDKQGVLAFWRTTMPCPEAKKRLFVDDEVLCNLFERLAEATEPSKLSFRFVLGLILMRKRLLVYESSRSEPDERGPRELWSVRMRGSTTVMDLLNPQLSEDQIRDVSQQLGAILNEEL